MAKEKFSIKEAYGYAWETFKQNWELFLVISIVSLLLSSPQNMFSNMGESARTIISLLFTVLSIIVSIGALKITLGIYDKAKPEIRDMFRYSRYFWRFLGATILYGLLVAFGLLLLVVPGFIWAMKYSMTINLIVDKDMRISEAFQESARLTSGVRWQLFLFCLASLGVLILGGIALGVGIIVAIPLTWIASVYVYRHLLKSADKKEVEAS